MSFLKDIFDDVVDIAAAPARLGANLIDKTIADDDETLTEAVKDLTEKVKGN